MKFITYFVSRIRVGRPVDKMKRNICLLSILIDLHTRDVSYDFENRRVSNAGIYQFLFSATKLFVVYSATLLFRGQLWLSAINQAVKIE